jgi:hypothetical protein
MAHACNIDAKGRLVRGLLGIAGMIVAIGLMLLWAIPTGSVVAWILVALGIAFGGFGLYEAYHGWCAARALGFKTRI